MPRRRGTRPTDRGTRSTACSCFCSDGCSSSTCASANGSRASGQTNSPAATAVRPAPSTPTGPVGANQFSTEAQAKARCPSDTVVWANLKSKLYHFSGTKDYGTTKHGAYMCERDTAASGMRAAKNETHP